MTIGTAKFGSLEDSTALLQSHVMAISEAIARTRQEIAEIREEQDAGRTRDELLGTEIWEEFPATLGSEFEQQYRHAAEAGEPVATAVSTLVVRGGE